VGSGFFGSAVVGDADCGRTNPSTYKVGYEGFLCSYDGSVYCIDMDNGDIIWNFDTGDHITTSPALCNIDLDNDLEVIIASNDGMIYCLDGDPADGTDEGITDSGNSSYDIIWEYDTQGSGAWVSSPVVADIDKDNNLEVVIGDRDGNVWCLNAGSAPVPAQKDWTMFQHDKFNSGFYPTKEEIFDISFDLLNGDGNDKNICYAKHKPYTFRAVVRDGMGFDELKEVVLTIAPEDQNIQVKWSQASDSFVELNDPNDLIEITSTEMNSNSDKGEQWTLDFKIIFNWTFDTELPIAYSVKSEGYVNPARSIYVKDFTYVENDLVFVGDLNVTSSRLGDQVEGSWVAGGDEVIWSNITPVYENSDNIYPSNTVLKISLTDEDDNVWYANDHPGEMQLYMVMPDITDPEHTFVLNVTNLPVTALDAGLELEFMLRLDNTPPTPPTSILLHADSYSDSLVEADDDTQIFATWASSKEEYSGIAGYYYGITDDGGTKQGTFTDQTQVELLAEQEGVYEFYIWAVDNVGNIGPSANATIHIDMNEIEFTAVHYPLWFNYSNVELEILISDTEGIGVDPTTIQYAIFKPSTEEFGPWISINQATDLTWQTENKTQVMVSSLIQFTENGVHYIKWRAKDLAGNGYTVSEYVRVQIDTELPSFNDPGAKSVNDFDPRQMLCNITIIDLGGSGIDPDSIFYQYSVSGIENYSTWKQINIKDVEDSTKIVAETTLTFNYGSNNYIRWRAIDQAGNGFSRSDDIKVIINTPPISIIKLPENNTNYYLGDKLEFDGTPSYDVDESDILSYYWTTTYTSALGHQTTEFIGSLKYFKTVLPVGSNLVQLKVSDGKYNVTSQRVFIFIYDDYTDLDKDGMPDWWEMQYPGLDPTDPSDALNDLDGDKTTNLDEFMAGTNPADSTSNPSQDDEKDKDSAETSLMSDPVFIINILVLIIVIIFLLSLFLFKRAKIKKERLQALQAAKPVVLLRRDGLPSPSGPRGIGSTQVMPKPSTGTPIPVPKQEPVPQLPPHHPTIADGTQTQTQAQDKVSSTQPQPSVSQTPAPSQPQQSPQPQQQTQAPSTTDTTQKIGMPPTNDTNSKPGKQTQSTGTSEDYGGGY
jgi:hypothetical protein